MKQVQTYFSEWTGPALTGAMIGVAVLLILAAITVKNRWIKAGILAYEILPYENIMKLHKILKWAVIIIVVYFVYMLWKNSSVSVAAAGSVGA